MITPSPLERAEHLLAAMTFDDKVNLVMGSTASLSHLGIPSLERVDASCGLRGDTGVTAFPVPIALSAAFDPELAYTYGAAIAQEAREHGWSVILGPTLDVERRGNSGRLPEGYGEDPLLNGIVGEHVARGMQDQHVIAVLKHLTAYNQETDRNTLWIDVSQRALHELYNAPFYHAIEQGTALGIMGSYPKINGVYACENATLMDDLRAETGWQGFMMSDFLAGEDPVTGFNAGIDTTTLYPNFPREAFTDGRISPARLDSAVRRTLYAIFASGLSEHPVGALETPKPVSTPAHKALAQRTAESGTVLLKNRDNLLPLNRQPLKTIAVIGCARRDVITGIEGSSYVIPGDYVTPFDAITGAAGGGIRVVFAQGTHGDHPLPVIPSEAFTAPDGTSPGLLGTFYASPDFSGSPVAQQITPTPDFAAAPVEGLPPVWSARWTGKITAPTTGPVNFSLLCTGRVRLEIDGQTVISGARHTAFFITQGQYYPLSGSIEMTAGLPTDIVVEFSTPFYPLDFVMGKHLHLGWQPEPLLPEAIHAAQQADVAIVFVNQASGEAMDRDSFTLPGDQNRLVQAVCRANPNTIVVLNTPGAVLMPWLDEASAVLQMWYPGEAAGTAIAAVLFGDAEPGGRLPVTFPAHEDQLLPPYTGSGSIEFNEGVFTGYRHFQQQGHTPLFPFGFGLSYTQFAYHTLEILSPENTNIAARVRVTVQNIGSRPGSEVVQVYTGELTAPVPIRQLAGFARITLQPGETQTVEIPIPWRICSWWDVHARGWVLAEGGITVDAGSSSADIRLTGRFSLFSNRV